MNQQDPSLPELSTDGSQPTVQPHPVTTQMPFVLSAPWKLAQLLNRWPAPSDPSSPLDGSLVDDIRHNRSGNVPVRWHRMKRRLRRDLRPGVTIVIVSYNSMRYLGPVLDAIERFSDPTVDVVVVDNASTDGSRKFAARHPAVRTVRLPFNIDHGRGLDVGLQACRTEFAVLLDSDAFPLRTGWLDVLTDPLDSSDVVAVGAHGGRDRLHPLCLGLRTEFYHQLGRSFDGRIVPGASREDQVWGVNRWDVGEYFSQGVPTDRRVLLDTFRDDRGEFVSDIVFHLREGTFSAAPTRRNRKLAAKSEQTQDRWTNAVRTLLPPDIAERWTTP